MFCEFLLNIWEGLEWASTFKDNSQAGVLARDLGFSETLVWGYLLQI